MDWHLSLSLSYTHTHIHTQAHAFKLDTHKHTHINTLAALITIVFLIFSTFLFLCPVILYTKNTRPQFSLIFSSNFLFHLLETSQSKLTYKVMLINFCFNITLLISWLFRIYLRSQSYKIMSAEQIYFVLPLVPFWSTSLGTLMFNIRNSVYHWLITKFNFKMFNPLRNQQCLCKTGWKNRLKLF